MPDITLKKDGYGLQIRTYMSVDRKSTYIVFKHVDGSYHAFVEVEAKVAAMCCGSDLDQEEHTRDHWNVLWGKE